MRNIWLISNITVKDGIRNRLLHGILFIALFSCVIYLTIIPMFAFDTGKVATDLGFASMTLSGLAVVIFLGIGLLTRDIHERSVCMVISRPVSRSQYVTGKFLGLSITILTAVLIMAVLSVFSGWIALKIIPEMALPRNFSWGYLLTAVIFNYLELLIVMALGFLFTVITTNAYLSMLFTFCCYIIGQTLETIVKVITSGEFVKVDAFYIKTLEILKWIFPNLRAFDLKVSVSYGLPLSLDYTIWTAVYGLIYISIIIFITTKIFNRQEIK